jgi:hypothetical protein
VLKLYGFEIAPDHAIYFAGLLGVLLVIGFMERLAQRRRKWRISEEVWAAAHLLQEELALWPTNGTPIEAKMQWSLRSPEITVIFRDTEELARVYVKGVATWTLAVEMAAWRLSAIRVQYNLSPEPNAPKAHSESESPRAKRPQNDQSQHVPEPVDDDWRTVLGLGQDASPADVKARHRVLLKQYHPDRVGGGDVTLMARINAARDMAYYEFGV